MITTLLLPEVLRAQLCAGAQAAFPRECCGLVEGTIESLTLSLSKGATARATALHPTRNLAARADRFEIDPAQHIALLRSLRGTDSSIVGCYHSHPNGIPEPSQHDLEGAAEEAFIWLIAVLENPTAEPSMAAFVATSAGFAPVMVQTR